MAEKTIEQRVRDLYATSLEQQDGDFVGEFCEYATEILELAVKALSRPAAGVVVNPQTLDILKAEAEKEDHGPLQFACREAYEALKSAPACGWRPIAEAPKGRPSVLIATRHGNVGEARWGANKERWYWMVDTEVGFEDEPDQGITHWMPLPHPPAQEGV